MVLLKKAVVLTRVIYELAQQTKSNYEELEEDCNLLLHVETIISQLHEEYGRHSEALQFMISGLESLHEILVRLDKNRGKLLFRPQPLLEKMLRLEQKLYLVAQRIATEGQNATQSDIEGHQTGLAASSPLVEDKVTRTGGSAASENKSTQINGKVTEDQQNGGEPNLAQTPRDAPSVGVEAQSQDSGQQKQFATLSVLDLVVLHPTAREFWVKHFGVQNHLVKWESFKAAFESEFGEQLLDNLKRLKKHLDCDHTSDDIISIFEYADFTDLEGLPDSFVHLTQRASCTFNPYAVLEDETKPMSSPEIVEKESKQVKEHPFDSNAVWQGVVTEGGCETVDMTLHITEKTGENIKGEILWTGDVLTKFFGRVHGDTITFEEYKVKKGINIIPFPNSYVGKVDFVHNTIIGKWVYNDQQGHFHLHLNLEATQSLTLGEKEDEDKTEQKSTFSGYLLKQGHGITKKWQHRFFVLEESVLNYCKSKSKYPHKVTGKIPMSHVMSIQDTPDVSKPLIFELITDDKTYYLQADTEEDKRQWLSVLKLELTKFEPDKSLDVYNI